jgi:hypothetical protein
MSLNQIFYANKDRPINKWTHYFPIYERYFTPFRNRHVNVLEIGTGQGGSCHMWKTYFGPAARIVTIDIRDDCPDLEDDQIKVRTGDQSDPVFLQSLLNEFGEFDIVIDDGSHQMAHVNATFEYLYPRIAKDAIYFIEDLHTSYLEGWGGGLKRDGTFFERLKNLIDELHARYGEGGTPTAIGEMTRGIHIYDSVAVLEKGPFLTKRPLSIPFVEGVTIW